jgi:AhpD family alkylhydroperoxidase
MSNSFYAKTNTRHFNKLKELAPEQEQAFTEFNDAVFQEGALSKKEKEIIAVAVAHATQCPYCIDVHTKNAVKAGATNNELSEAILVTSALLAGGSMLIWQI